MGDEASRNATLTPSSSLRQRSATGPRSGRWGGREVMCRFIPWRHNWSWSRPQVLRSQPYTHDESPRPPVKALNAGILARSAEFLGTRLRVTFRGAAVGVTRFPAEAHAGNRRGGSSFRDRDPKRCSGYAPSPAANHTQSRSSGLLTPSGPLASTCVSIIVVFRSACPNSSCNVRMS